MSDDGTQRRRAVAEVASEALRHLTWLADAGVTELPAPSPVPLLVRGEPGASRSGSAAPGTAAPPALRPGPGPSGPAATPLAGSRGEAPYSLSDKGCGSEPLLRIREEIGECARCKLAQGRTRLVFGVGNPSAELLFVGEGPGADEDREGEPFVGRAGQLLTKMIEAMGYRRDDVYIANVVKCRPPGNRNPEPDEIEACEPFLRAQIREIGPKVIVALGKFAAQTLLRDTTPITRLRGRWFSYGGVRLMPTFHPAYLLRSPEEKKKAWEDLQLVMKELGRTVTRR